MLGKCVCIPTLPLPDKTNVCCDVMLGLLIFIYSKCKDHVIHN